MFVDGTLNEAEFRIHLGECGYGPFRVNELVKEWARIRDITASAEFEEQDREDFDTHNASPMRTLDEDPGFDYILNGVQKVDLETIEFIVGLRRDLWWKAKLRFEKIDKSDVGADDTMTLEEARRAMKIACDYLANAEKVKRAHPDYVANNDLVRSIEMEDKIVALRGNAVGEATPPAPISTFVVAESKPVVPPADYRAAWKEFGRMVEDIAQ
jgi:hypothetical protein